MYKMKDVCRLTGLSEKTIRYYITQELISPKIEHNLHYRSYRFSKQDIEQILDISTLRSADFTIAQIRQMMTQPESVPSIIVEKGWELDEKISSIQKLQDVIRNLTIEDHTNLSRITDAIEPRTPQRKEQPSYAHKRLLWLTVYAGLFLMIGLLTARARGFKFITMLLFLLAGTHFPVMGIAYLFHNRKHRELPCKGVGTVEAIITDEGIDAYWEPTVWETAFGMLNIGFIHWNWIRPDHWIPLVRFEAEAGTVLTAYRYGGLKGSWTIGQTLPIAWVPGSEKQIYPCSDPMIARKGWSYLILGILSTIAFIMLMFRF